MSPGSTGQSKWTMDTMSSESLIYFQTSSEVHGGAPPLFRTAVLLITLRLGRLGKNVYINFNSVWLDTCTIEVGDCTLIGPNCSFYSATHPLDPYLRKGTQGPEYGKSVKIGGDCWFGGNCIVLPGVTIGKGVTVGAGSVVTKDVPDFVAVAGNPARIIKEVPTSGEHRIS